MGIWDALAGVLSTGISTAYQVKKDQQLTGAEREANAFSAQQADIARNFEAQQAEIARDWQESQYLKYNSPAAMVRQYQEAGLNPALMYQSTVGSSASTSTSIPSASAPSSVTPKGGGNLAEMVANLSMLAAQIKNIKADTANKQAIASESEHRTNLLSIDEQYQSLIKTAELSKLGVETDKLSSDISLINSNIDKNKSQIDLNSTQNSVQRLQLDLLKIDKQFKPSIYNQSLEKGKLDIEQARLLCSKLVLEQSLVQAQIQGIEVNNELTSKKIQTEIWNADKVKNERFILDRQSDLLYMQKVLTESQSKEVQAKTVMQEWVNCYIKKYGHAPDNSTYSWMARYFGSPAN